ncbi:DUF6300 family protein [Streptomyces erythrochromogenes]|uniref:DUF6300 family protein n=1 Tax=Streptomyces erythrochromogenes TaxID=285574 RepID=UPI0034377331
MLGEQDDDQSGLSVTVEDVAPCARCGGAAVLRVSIPHSWQNNLGQDVRGTKEASLCPACDHADPAATELLALFAVDDRVTLENAHTWACLASAWVERLRTRTVDAQRLQEEWELWRRGEL